jgi:hypothetical protein
VPGSGAGGAVPVVPAASGATPIATGSGASASASDLAYTGPGLVTGVLLMLALGLLGLGTAAVVSRRRASLAPAFVTGSPREEVPSD